MTVIKALAMFFGGILTWASVMSVFIQGVTVAVQSVRYNVFTFFGGWDWLGWSIGGLIVGVTLLGIGFVAAMQLD